MWNLIFATCFSVQFFGKRVFRLRVKSGKKLERGLTRVQRASCHSIYPGPNPAPAVDWRPEYMDWKHPIRMARLRTSGTVNTAPVYISTSPLCGIGWPRELKKVIYPIYSSTPSFNTLQLDAGACKLPTVCSLMSIQRRTRKDYDRSCTSPCARNSKTAAGRRRWRRRRAWVT